ncbi:hypothetical protein ACWC5I_18540 [Kitasatospora sp. NPDC001574]
MSLKEFADQPLLTALVSEASRGAETRAGARPHGGSGTIARGRPKTDDPEDDEPPTGAADTASAILQAAGLVYEPEPSTGDPGDPGDPGGSEGPGDDGEPPHHDGGEPTGMADQPIALTKYVHSGLDVRVANWLVAKVGIHTTETEGRQLLNITIMIIMSALAVGYAAYTATHADSLPGGTTARLAVILLPPAGLLACAVFTITRHKATGPMATSHSTSAAPGIDTGNDRPALDTAV